MNRLRALRLTADLTLGELGQASGVSTGSISRMERGESNGSNRSLARLAGSLGLTVIESETLLAPAAEFEIA